MFARMCSCTGVCLCDLANIRLNSAGEVDFKYEVDGNTDVVSVKDKYGERR